MKSVYLAVGLVVMSTLAHAEDVAQMISQYRHEHGLSAVKTDLKLTAIAERQAKAMAASGIMDHNVAGSFVSRVSGAHLGMAAENIAAGTKTWAETIRFGRPRQATMPIFCNPRPIALGSLSPVTTRTRYKTFWAMVIAEKSPKKKDRKAAEGSDGMFWNGNGFGRATRPLLTR